jgi:hypothetical protein
VITPILPYHTWTFGAPKSSKSPYYECVTIYRQQKPKTWNETFQKLYKDFEKRFDLKHIDHPSHDKEPKKINLGCGYMKLDGYLNVDASEFVEPDQVVDLQQLPWPYEDDEFQNIVAKDILEHLGNDKHTLVDIIKEMYRVSENGAVWEVQVPHHRSDHAWDDPTHKRPITPGTFKLFNQKNIVEGMEIGRSDSTLAIELGIDIDVCDVKYTYVGKWIEMLRDKQITEEQLEFALHTQSNVAESTILLLQVHKPPRYTVQELNNTIKRRDEKRKAALALTKPE